MRSNLSSSEIAILRQAQDKQPQEEHLRLAKTLILYGCPNSCPKVSFELLAPIFLYDWITGIYRLCRPRLQPPTSRPQSWAANGSTSDKIFTWTAGRISTSLSEYQDMISQSQSSMEGLISMLAIVQKNLPGILNGAVLVFSAFFLWLLAAQVVILTQGLELYRGTADRLESAPSETGEA